MKAAGARALLSAKCTSRRLPRVPAVLPSSTPVNGTTSGAYGPREQRRSFRASAPVLSRPDDPNPAAPAEEKKTTPPSPAPAALEGKKLGDTKTTATTTPPSDDADAAAKDTNPGETQHPPIASSNSEPTPPPPAAADTTSTYKESLRSQGYGSARARANRVRAEEVPPPLGIPSWFVERHVSLYESRPIGSPLTLLFPLEEADRAQVLDVLEAQFARKALSKEEVAAWREWTEEGLRWGLDGERGKVLGFAEKALEALAGRARALHVAGFLQVLAIVHQQGADPEHIERLRRHHEEKGDEIARMLWRFDEPPLSGEAQRWLANIRSDSQPGSGALHGSPLASRPEPEYPACMEFLAAIRAELLAEGPGSKLRELQRPVTILSVLNRKGRSVAVSVVNDIATDLKADVVHLDASTLAELLGGHLGQNLHWSRGSVSMLGYTAAEMNGRLASRADVDGDHEVGIHVSLPPRLRSFLSSEKSSGMMGAFDGRWEELKMVQGLESLVAAADVKRDIAAPGSAQSDRPLIIHLHDFVEISSLSDSIVAKLRHIVDRMWQKGRKVVLVGSSSSDINKPSQWRDQLIELGRDGSHVIPFHASETSEWMERNDNLHENINNIKNMIQAMLGDSANAVFDTQIHFDGDGILVDKKYTGLVQTLSEYVYDVQWVYRLAALMMGSRTPRFKSFTLANMQYALDIMSHRNKHWTSINPGVRPPYFSPLFTPRASMPSFMSNNPEEWNPGNMAGPGPQSSGSSTEYDQHEKKLLSGLINAKDIHTTFNDIIVPAETKESLIGLTSLSLTRPDAFSYGVLKTERIPGCLLYGPPGTGKTLLAKAVAKESGANMLEVSAASINDMWLGQSEKNVRALFSLARKMAPMVIFLDEADALLGARHNAPGRNSHRETITQFLREWDGLSDMRAFIMVATNRPFDLDEAVLRRLPRKILVDLPLTKEREGILRVMLREESIAEEVDLAKLAADTELYSGSDLKNLCVSAAMEAVREEVRQKEAWQGEEPFVFPERRVLTRAHFDKGMREISASISEDMDSLKSIRKFDAQYGDSGRKKKGRRSMGFEVVEEKKGSEEARVRQVTA